MYNLCHHRAWPRLATRHTFPPRKDSCVISFHVVVVATRKTSFIRRLEVDRTVLLCEAEGVS